MGTLRSAHHWPCVALHDFKLKKRGFQSIIPLTCSLRRPLHGLSLQSPLAAVAGAPTRGRLHQQAPGLVLLLFSRPHRQSAPVCCDAMECGDIVSTEPLGLKRQ
jgi:hypothetical protein